MFRSSFLIIQLSISVDFSHEIRDAMLDQIVWKDFVRTARDDLRPK